MNIIYYWYWHWCQLHSYSTTFVVPVCVPCFVIMYKVCFWYSYVNEVQNYTHSFYWLFVWTNTNSAGWFNIFFPMYMQFDGDKWGWGWKRGMKRAYDVLLNGMLLDLLILLQGWYCKTHFSEVTFTISLNQNMNRWKTDWIIFGYACRKRILLCHTIVLPSHGRSNWSNDNSSWLWPNFIEILALL